MGYLVFSFIFRCSVLGHILAQKIMKGANAMAKPDPQTTTKISDEARALAITIVEQSHKHFLRKADWGNADFEGLIQRALDARPQPATQWQDISTAPKGGTKIIGYRDGRVTQVYYGNYYLPCWMTGNTLPTMNAEPETFEPTHWMPLPEPPNQSPRSAPPLGASGKLRRVQNSIATPTEETATPENGDWVYVGAVLDVAYEDFNHHNKALAAKKAMNHLRAASAEQDQTIARLREALTKIANPMADEDEGDAELNYTRRSIAYQALADTAQKGDGK